MIIVGNTFPRPFLKNSRSPIIHRHDICNLSNYSLLVGLQSNSSRHGCPWCTITTRNNCPGAFSSGPNLSPNERESEMLFYKKENPKKPKETIVVPRTLGQIKKLAEIWQEL